MDKVITWLATANFVLPLVGYVLITSIFLMGENSGNDDIDSISQGITIPYRFFTMVISLLVILLASKKGLSRIPKHVKWLFVFWILLILRMFYDLGMRTDLLGAHVNVSRTLLYIPICILPALALLVSHNKVNYKYAFHIVFWGFIVSLILMIANNPLLLLASDELMQRVAGNLAFSTLQLATFGASIIIMCLYAFSVRNYNRILLVILVLFALLVLLRAASRGPMVALVVVLAMYVMSSFKNPSRIISILTIIVVLLFAFSDVILNAIEDISPVLVERLRPSESTDFTNGRAGLYAVAIEKFLNSPLWGDSFAIFSNDPIALKNMIHVSDMSESGYIWSHNMILDAFMGLGIIGGVIFLYVYIAVFKKSYELIKRRDYRIWFVMLTVLKVVAGFFSGAFYLNDSLTFCIVAIFLICFKPKVRLKPKCDT